MHMNTWLKTKLSCNLAKKTYEILPFEKRIGWEMRNSVGTANRTRKVHGAMQTARRVFQSVVFNKCLETARNFHVFKGDTILSNASDSIAIQWENGDCCFVIFIFLVRQSFNVLDLHLLELLQRRFSKWIRMIQVSFSVHQDFCGFVDIDKMPIRPDK